MSNTITPPTPRPTYAEKKAKEAWESLHHDKAGAHSYFTVLADYIDTVVKPFDHIFPSDGNDLLAMEKFYAKHPELKKLALKDMEMFPFQQARNHLVEKIKWKQLVEEPQIYRQMVHYMGMERTEHFFNAMLNIPKVTPHGDMNPKAWNEAETFYANQREHFSYIKYATPLHGARSDKDFTAYTPEQNRAHWKSVLTTTRPKGTWQGWTEEPPRIPYQDKTRGR